VELDAATLSLIVGAVVTGVAGALGGTKVAAGRRAREDAAEEGRVAAHESVVSKAEAAAMVAEAERLARIEHNTTAILQQQHAHAEADERRFQQVEAFARETRTKVHALTTDVQAHKFELPYLRDRIDDARRLLNIDSGVTDVREIERRAREAGR
jgi:hypothetical protein